VNLLITITILTVHGVQLDYTEYIEHCHCTTDKLSSGHDLWELCSRVVLNVTSKCDIDTDASSLYIVFIVWTCVASHLKIL